jgi:hypothetical protein
MFGGEALEGHNKRQEVFYYCWFAMRIGILSFGFDFDQR